MEDKMWDKSKSTIIADDINSLPNDKNLDWSRFKAFADDKINVTEKSKLVLGQVKNIVGKRENAGFQCFQKPSYTGSLKVVIVW